MAAAEQEEAKKNTEHVLPDDFYYKKEDFIPEKAVGEVHRLNLSLTYPLLLLTFSWVEC